jgi:hypothetical protein
MTKRDIKEIWEDIAHSLRLLVKLLEMVEIEVLRKRNALSKHCLGHGA